MHDSFVHNFFFLLENCCFNEHVGAQINEHVGIPISKAAAMPSGESITSLHGVGTYYYNIIF